MASLDSYLEWPPSGKKDGLAKLGDIEECLPGEEEVYRRIPEKARDRILRVMARLEQLDMEGS